MRQCTTCILQKMTCMSFFRFISAKSYIQSTACAFKMAIGKAIMPEVPISADALRMRVRRLCERKSGGKLNVPTEVHEDFVNGGSSREILEIALLEAIQKYGCERKQYKRVRVPW